MFGLQPAQPNLAAMAYAEFQANEERDRQRAIIRARNYYKGDQLAYLSARLKEFLALDNAVNPDNLFHLNIARQVVTAVTERMSVTGFSADDTQQAETAQEWWQQNRLDAKQKRVYRAIRRDGEHFVLVDWANGKPRFTPHPRYTDPQVDGDGYGCKAFYPNGDITMPMSYASKRWTEDYTNPRGEKAQRQRMTLYFADRIEKYSLESGKWEPFVEADADGVAEEWPLPWVHKDGTPLGIAAIHFQNDDLECDIDSSVVSQQNLLNKTLVDMAESADQSGFPIWKAFGFIPTSDGQPLNSTGSNKLTMKPNTIVGTTTKPGEASLDRVPGETPQPLMEIAERVQLWVARIKNIPASRFQITGQIAAEGTLKQQESPLHAICEEMQVVTGDGWEDAFYLGRRLANTFANANMDESVMFDAQWAPLDVRSDDRDDPVAFWSAAESAVRSGSPLKVFLKRQGWSEADMADIPDAQPAQAADPNAVANGKGQGAGAGDMTAIQKMLQPHLDELKAALSG